MPLARLDLARRAGLTQFGGPVSYTPAAGGPAFEVFGVFSTPHVLVELPGAETQVTTAAPVLGVDLPDFVLRKVAAGHPATGPADRDTFVRDGVTWRVVDVQPDTEGGGLNLNLHRV